MAEMEMSDLPDSETTCTICSAEFLDPDDLTVHITQMHAKKDQPTFKSCQFCTDCFSDLEDYALHIRDEHLLNLRSCKYCNRVFNDFDEYRKHESKHYTYVARGMYSCSECHKLYNNVSELELHETREHYSASSGVFINDCLPFLSSVLNIKAKNFLQSFGDEVDYMCVKCEMTTPDPEIYVDHLKKKNCRSLACNSCSSAYRHKKGLSRHLSLHQECRTNGKPVFKQCLECYKMFDVKLWRDHTKHCKAIKCKTCNIVFGSMYDLSKHQTEAHPLIVTLESCKYCHREFAGAAALNKHISRAHRHETHLYKYKCSYCTAIFKHPKRLFAHFYSTHKDLEPYTCKICDKKFKIRKKFTIHIKLDHKSIGYIEFDENCHVHFTDKKSEKCIDTTKSEDADCFTDNGDADNDQRQESNEKMPLHVNSGILSATEAEGNQTEIEEKPKPRAKRKLQRKHDGIAKKRMRRNVDTEVVISDSSDDEPLLELKKRVTSIKSKLKNATWNRKRRKTVKDNKRRFICNICKKYCYTFQNYHNHVALHYKNVTLKCVKCTETFSSQEDLNEHYSKEHSTSKLTQTLKNLLEKRKNGVQINSAATSTEKFERTIKKVCLTDTSNKATLTEVNEKLSVQKFIESFTPEDAPKKKTLEINTSVVLKPIEGPCPPPKIKLTKCNLAHTEFGKVNLCMPVRFRQIVGETHKVTVKEVSVSDLYDAEDNSQTLDDDTYIEEESVDRNDSIPDVAQEVMLEVSEEPPPKALYIPHRVVLPTLPKEYNKIRIAHLQSEAPYYKIVKVEDVLNPQPQLEKPKPVVEKAKVDIKLPDGTKLVTVNPLAHLLGDTPVEKILENSKNKYYQPKSKDFEVAIAKAMLRLEKPEAFPKKKRKKN